MFKRWSLLVLATLTVSIATAGPIGYAVQSSSGTLVTVDLATNTPATIGTSGQFLEGLAISPGGGLFATGSSGNLYTLNSSTGAATLVGSTGKGNIEGLDFNGSTLLGVTFTSTPTVFSINTGTAATTDIITAAGSVGGVPRALAVLNANTVYLAAGSSGYQLYTLNLTTGAVALIGTIGSGGEL